MPQSDLTALNRKDGNLLPLVLAGVVVLLVGLVNFVSDPLFGAAAIVGIIGVLILTAQPAYSVILMLGSFLVTYPVWLQGRGGLTINNALGAWLLVMMIYRIYTTGDLSFLRNRELHLLAAIVVVYLVSRLIHRPDDHTMELVTALSADEEDPAKIIVNRLIFFVFLIYFIRSPAQVRILFVLAVALMIASGFSGIGQVLGGGGFAGYRARSGAFINAAGNPNRLALTAVISIIALWYLILWLRSWIVAIVLGGVILVEVLAVFMTGSRSGVVALGLALAILFADGGVSLRKVMVTGLAVTCAGLLILQTAPEKSLQRIENIPGTDSESDVGSGSVQRRSYTAELALSFAETSPLIGVGLGNWEITRYLSDPVHNITPAHSAVLTALAEGGIITLGLYVWVMWRTMTSFLASNRAVRGREHTGWNQWMAKTLRASFMVFCAMSLVGDLWLNIIFYWYIGLGVTLPRMIFGQNPALAEDPDPSDMLAEAAA